MSTSRREFLAAMSKAGFGALALQASRAFALDRVENPLESYPSRDWEKVYRDLWKTDDAFVFLCAPNDTHNCLLKAQVRNGVVLRIAPTFGYGKATDVYGNKASARWDPRICQKGLALTRRIYGDRRVKYPMVRKGFKEWVKAGFPRDPAAGLPLRDYFRRAEDTWERAAWDEAASLVAKALVNIATTYTGDEGKKRLLAQGYEPEVVDAVGGIGVRALKFRGGMPLLGLTRVFGMYRVANAMALLDAKIRGVGPDQAKGGTGWDNYSWHTDLPPGHPMVTGQQTVDFDLHMIERADLALIWGMNWITTKMPDSHWLTEARIKGTRVVVIACEYSATSNKADEVIVVRPGTTPALALGLAHVVLKEKLYDHAYVEKFTDLPFLVRMDTLKLLRAQELDGRKPAALSNQTRVLGADEKPPPPFQHTDQLVPLKLREEWGDFVLWDAKRGGPVAVTRDMVGEKFARTGLSPQLEGAFEVKLVSGETVKVRPVFDLITEYAAEFTPEKTEAMTWAPKDAVVKLAREIAQARGKTVFAMGMGPNQFFNNDLKDRAVFLLASLTGSVGRIGGNVGSYAGNYRVALFNGLPQYINENPFDLELDAKKPARPKQYWRAESAHYYNHEDHPLKVGSRMLTGKSHMPCPTKSMWFCNANSILGNVKWHYNTVFNVLPRIEMIAVQEWWWTTSCEWADVVFAADSWAEMKHPDVCASVTNPFLTVYPETPLPRVHDTRSDIEIQALVMAKMAEETGDKRFLDVHHFVREGKTAVYLQRVLENSSSTRGYKFDELHARAKQGIPALMMTRTTPRNVGYEQTEESRPWYTKTGRLEFYRDEPEFIAAGENLPVHREPIDSTFYEPNVIVAPRGAALRPEGPGVYGVRDDDLSPEVRQGRNVVKAWDEVARTQHPLAAQGFKFIFHTPKYRHGAHTTPVDTDFVAMLFGPFGDVRRHDKRTPFVTEGYIDIHPEDARELGVDDGDYVWVDADPEDRPFRGWKEGDPRYKVARLLCRARFYPGTPRGVTRMWFNMYGATPGSVRGHETRPDGLARNDATHYQAMFRYGSHQSGTRGWLKPTLMTDSLVRKEALGQVIGKGFLPDVHCPTGAPRESFVKITRAEPGGLEGKGLWRPAQLGLRPSYESEPLKRYLDGAFISTGAKRS